MTEEGLRCAESVRMRAKNKERKGREKKEKNECFCPVSNRGPFACEANVITTTLQKRCAALLAPPCYGRAPRAAPAPRGVTGVPRPREELGRTAEKRHFG